jgi:hypothetical protein
MGIKRHVARFGALARREQKRQVRLLKVAQGRTGLFQKRLPVRVVAPVRLQVRGDGMGDVIRLHTVRRLLSKQGDALAHVAAVIGDDLHRHTRPRAHLFQHRRHPKIGTLERHLHGQHRHVAMPWRIAGLGQPGDGNAEHDQAFQRAQAHRLINDENPIVAPRQGALQAGQTQPTAPIQHGGRGRDTERQVACQQAQHPTDPATTEAGVQVQLQAELHHLQGIMAAIPGERLFSVADQCRS